MQGKLSLEAGPPWLPTLWPASSSHPHYLLSGPCQALSPAAPSLPLQKRSPPGLRSPTRCSCCQQSPVGAGQPPNPTEAVPLTRLSAGPWPAAPPSRPFLHSDRRKFTLDVTCISPKVAAPLLHLNSPGCPHPHPGALISCQPRTALCPSGENTAHSPPPTGGVRGPRLLPLTALCVNTAVIHRPREGVGSQGRLVAANFPAGLICAFTWRSLVRGASGCV